MKRVTAWGSIALLLVAALQARPVTVITIDASKPAPGPETGALPMGGKAPGGRELGVNSRYMTLDGAPWLPVMAEMHFARYPERYWEEEILKMKAGGVRIVATYVFWIHHEEIEGQFDWSGQRNLRGFVELCAKHGMFVWARIGPWAHGECRNGGFPDWLPAKCATRRNDPTYLSYVGRLYEQIGRQLKGLYWKDGGPVIGVQFENEYLARGPGQGAEHYRELKRLAREAGIEAPFYSVTGWGNPDFPPREVIPVFGGYPDAFWDRTIAELPPSPHYFFGNARSDDSIGNDLQAPASGNEARLAPYPFFTAEMGGGMQVAYHRRPVIGADDLAAMMLAKLGSGVTLYGYYMFHGGSNPQGKLTTLQESQVTGYPNDLPVVSYDFQAPLGEFGQMRPSFRVLKLFHLFLKDFGDYLAPMIPFSPDRKPTDIRDNTTPRLAARIQGDRGFIFFNDYQRTHPLPPHSGVRIALKLPSETLDIPRQPIDIPADAYFIWPVNLDLGGVTLRYATAQLLCKLDNTYFFFATPGIAAEFAIDAQTLAAIEAPKGVVSSAQGLTYVTGTTPGTGVALTVHCKTGKTTRIVVFTRNQAEDCWKASVGGRERLFLSPADLFFDSTRLHLRARDPGNLTFAVFPTLPLRQSGRDGIFVRYTAQVAPKKIPVRWERIHPAAPSLPVKMGNEVALAPTEADFDRAGVWRITLPKDALVGLSDAFLRIQYAGDVARIYAGNRLLTDDFYKGTDFEIGLKRFGPEVLAQGLTFKVLPLRRDAPIYIPRAFRPAFPANGETATVSSVTAEPEYEVVAGLGAGKEWPSGAAPHRR